MSSMQRSSISGLWFSFYLFEAAHNISKGWSFALLAWLDGWTFSSVSWCARRTISCGRPSSWAWSTSCWSRWEYWEALVDCARRAASIPINVPLRFESQSSQVHSMAIWSPEIQIKVIHTLQTTQNLKTQTIFTILPWQLRAKQM